MNTAEFLTISAAIVPDRVAIAGPDEHLCRDRADRVATQQRPKSVFSGHARGHERRARHEHAPVRIARQVRGAPSRIELARARTKQHVCDWKPSDPAGDCLFVGETVALMPGVWPAMREQFRALYPHWAALPWLTFRHKRLMRFDAGANRWRPEPLD